MKHLASFLLLIFIATESFAAAQLQKIHNVVKNVSGNAFVKNKNKELIAIKNGAILKPGDIIYTGPGSSFEIHFEDESVMTVTSLTVMKVDELLANQNPGQSEPSYQSKFKLRVGEVRASVSRKTGVLKKFEVQTPVGTASVRGTEKIVNYSPDAGMKVNTLHGQVLVMANNGIEKYVNQGEFTKALGMQTQLPQAELQLEQAKPFITNESEQYILENRGLEVTQEANQILVSQVTKEQSQGPEAIVEVHQEAQQDPQEDIQDETQEQEGVPETPAQNLPQRPDNWLDGFDEAAVRRQAEIDSMEAVYRDKFNAVYAQGTRRMASMADDLATRHPGDLKESLSQAIAYHMPSGQIYPMSAAQNLVEEYVKVMKLYYTMSVREEVPLSPAPLVNVGHNNPGFPVELEDLYQALVAAGHASAVPPEGYRERALEFLAKLGELELVQEMRDKLQEVHREHYRAIQAIVDAKRNKFIEAKIAAFEKEFEEQMKMGSQASLQEMVKDKKSPQAQKLRQQVQQVININKLVAGL